MFVLCYYAFKKKKKRGNNKVKEVERSRKQIEI